MKGSENESAREDMGQTQIIGRSSKMESFMKIFMRVAEKYAEYVENRIKTADENEIQPGIETFIGEEETRGHAVEMRTLNQTAQTLLEYERYMETGHCG